MKQLYIEKNFRSEAVRMINIINGIVDEYRAQRYILTARQLYYQLVARDYIPNKVSEYKRITNLVNDAKLAGLIDWDMLEDRARNVIDRAHWEDPQSIISASASSYYQDHWDGQENRVFCIVEKEALAGVLERVCRQYDVPLLPAKGYPSGSILREFALERLREAIDQGQTPIVLHLGDHDPSGIDMTRDIQERLSLFAEDYVEVKRIALNMAQVEEQQPPENPAKDTDTRFAYYAAEFGDSSWELDALSPKYLSNLVKTHVENYIDNEAWQRVEDEIKSHKLTLQYMADNYDAIEQQHLEESE